VMGEFVQYVRPLVGELLQYSPALMPGFQPMGAS
jgi:hypothetical protein